MAFTVELRDENQVVLWRGKVCLFKNDRADEGPDQPYAVRSVLFSKDMDALTDEIRDELISYHHIEG